MGDFKSSLWSALHRLHLHPSNDNVESSNKNHPTYQLDISTPYISTGYFYNSKKIQTLCIHNYVVYKCCIKLTPIKNEADRNRKLKKQNWVGDCLEERGA